LTYDLKRILGEIAQTEQKEFGVARESDTLADGRELAELTRSVLTRRLRG
jgi:hypothetical protein